jgi:hypothetical protein
MNADFLVLKVHDEVASLEELQEGEAQPLGSREQVRRAVEHALPAARWPDGASSLWWSGAVFSIEIGLPPEEEPVRSLTLKIRCHPEIGPSGWLPEDEEELDMFLVGLCDPYGWSLFDLASGRLHRFRDEQDDDWRQPTWREVGLVN